MGGIQKGLESWGSTPCTAALLEVEVVALPRYLEYAIAAL